MPMMCKIRTRRQPRRAIPATPAAIRKQWVGKWIGQPIEQWNEREEPKVLADWTNRWKAGLRRLERVVQPGTDPGSQAIPEDTLTEQSGAKAPFRAPKSRKLSASTGPDRPNRSCEIPV